MSARTTSTTALFFGPHPDDVELFAGGTAARLARLGHRVVICDLTRGERASNGTVEQRAEEAAAAAQILGVERRNLALPDGGLRGDDPEQIRAVAECIRDVRPNVVFGPVERGRHPDHEAAAQLIRAAVFRAGLRNAEADGEAHRADTLFGYVCRIDTKPSFVVPLSDADRERKAAAIAAHGSQVAPVGGSATLVGHAAFADALDARDRYWGAHAGTEAAEPFVTERTLVLDDPLAWTLAHPANGVHWFTGGGS